MSQTIRQRRDLQIGRAYDHKPNHFRFERRCEGIYVEPDALPGDKFVAWACVCLCAMLGVAAAMWVAS